MKAHNRSSQTIREYDNKYYMHPWEGMDSFGQADRTISASAEGIYVYDEHGNRLIDGPGGMWCTQIGYGRRPGATLHAHGNSATPKFPKVCGGTQTQPILVFVLFVHGPNLQKKIYINCGFVPKKNFEAL